MWVHVICHIINIENRVDPDRKDKWLEAYHPGYNETLNGAKTQDTRADVYLSTIGITGILLTAIFTVVYIFALDTFRNLECAKGTILNNFNWFWGVHHLIIFALAL